MPEFPVYRGELPECLNLLNPRHYVLLAHWVYFRPTALKCYLYRAAADLYREGPGLGIFRTLRVPAYRNLYLMVPVVTAFSAVLLGIPAVLLPSWIQNIPAIWFATLTKMVAVYIATGLVLGVVVGVAFGLMFGPAVGIASGVAFGVASGTGFGVGAAVAFGLPTIMSDSIAESMTVGILAGLMFGAAFGLAGITASSTVLGVLGGVMVSISNTELETFGIAFIVGILRIPLFLLQFLPALITARQGRGHPLEWDELVVLPLPGTRPALARRLQRDQSDGLDLLTDVARNPFQRWAVQRVSRAYLHSQATPLHFLYDLLLHPDLHTYVLAPISKENWEQLPTSRQLLLGELGGQLVDCSSDLANRLFERLVWAVTRPLRDRRVTSLTRFARLLYELLDEEAVEADDFDLSTYAQVYTSLGEHRGGEDIARSFEALTTFLSYNDISALPAAVDAVGIRNQVFNKNLVSTTGDDVPIRPAVLSALGHLAQVGAEVATFRDATSRVNQLAALARATDALDGLDDYAVTEVAAPEQYILRRIIRQWRRLVSEAGGEVGRAEEAGPVANPYVVGNPVTGALFVGRQDILRRLEELWTGEGQKPSVVLYGHRRMGKSSILHNLGARFGTGTVIVDFNMQRVGLVESTNELLYNLALALYDAETGFLSANQVSFDEPDEERFTAHNPYTAFDRFLKRLDRARAGRRFIVTLDEFELIEQLIAEGRLEPRLLDFWRGLIQTYPWFIMAFAGLHTLQEMTHDYWHPLYGSVIGIPVSFLGRDGAWRLITQPTPDFPLDYDGDAVERIIALANGQPYLTQLIGHALVTRFNRQTFEQGVERERRFDLADIEAIITAPEFYRDGDAYFTGVWRQAETSAPPAQTVVLRALADLSKSPEPPPRSAGLSTDEVARQTGLTPEEVGRALETLVRHDVAKEEDGRWQFTVELMRRWVAQRS